MIVNYIYISLHIMSTYDSIIINNFVIKLMTHILYFINLLLRKKEKV